MANRHLGEVAADEFGNGCVIRLDMDGLARIEEEYGEFTWAPRLYNGLSMVSAVKIRTVLNLALRNNKGTLFLAGGSLPSWPTDKPLAPLAKKCQDALTLFIYGKSYDEWQAQPVVEEEDADADPKDGAEVL
ncbi:hypothetical protein D3227_25720 [Mesorhizobium waimense]|uniref:Uncharacterized protein n=1 Tax=Mesorhizobium waimense TaxID=1300307 RepID=A0A3A5KNR5_9HYPH|nr:hypothetical protein [Mesorhizobium waimense]RJT32801.1 hypothetical protein D3227_25720 [Mesorhizobium waimense]